MRKLLALLGFLSSSCYAAIGGGIGGSFINNANTLQPNATFYVSSGTVTNLQTKTLKFNDGTTMITAAAGGSGASALAVNVNAVAISSPTAAISFDNNFTGLQSPAGTANISINPSSTLFIQNRNTLQTGSTFYVSSATIRGPTSILSNTLQAFFLPTSTETFSLVNTSSHQVYILFKSSGVSWWRMGNDVTNTGTPEFSIYNVSNNLKDIAISTSDVMTINASVIMPNLSVSQPVKTNASKQLITSLINLTSDVTGTLPTTNLPSNIAYTNVGQTFSGSNVFTSSQTFGQIKVSTIVWGDGTIQVSSPTSSGGSSNGVSVYSATSTASFPYGLSASTITIATRIVWPDGTIQVSSPSAGGSVLPGGSNSNVQYNDSSAFGGDSGFQYDKSVSSISLTGNIGLTASQPTIKFNTTGFPNTFASQTAFYGGFSGGLAGTFGLNSAGTIGKAGGSGFIFKDSGGNSVAKIGTSQYIYTNQGLFNDGSFSFSTNLKTNSFTADTTGYYYRVDTTFNNSIVVTFPALNASDTSGLTNLSYLICRQDTSTNTVTFAKTGDDNFYQSGITLDNAGDCILWTSNTPASSSVGTWYPALRVATMTTTGVSSGTYTNTNLTVDQFGRITAASNGTSGGGGGASSLEVFNNFNGSRSSPTASIGMSNAFAGSVSGSTFTFDLNSSSVTLQGVLNDIHNQNTLQSGSTFYVSSGTVNGALLAISNSPGTVPLTAMGISGQVAGLQEWKNSAGIVLNRFGPDGKTYYGNLDTGGIHNFYGGTGLEPLVRLQYAAPTNGTVILDSIHGGTVTGSVIPFRAVSASTVDAIFNNIQSGPGNSVFKMSNLGAVGDAKLIYEFNGAGTDWTEGVDRSDNYKYKIGTTQILGANDRITISPSGLVAIGISTATAQLQINTVSSNTIGQIIQGSASQTANLQEWRDSTGAVLSSVSASGNITASTVTVTTAFVFSDGTRQITAATGGSGTSIYAATATASFPFGLSASTGVFTSTVSAKAFFAGIVRSSSTIAITGDITTATDTAHPVPTISSCGTGSTLSNGATDTSGTITVAGVTTNCTLTFGKVKNKPANCAISSSGSIANQTAIATISTLIIGSTASLGGDAIMYVCGFNE